MTFLESSLFKTQGSQIKRFKEVQKLQNCLSNLTLELNFTPCACKSRQEENNKKKSYQRRVVPNKRQETQESERFPHGAMITLRKGDVRLIQMSDLVCEGMESHKEENQQQREKKKNFFLLSGRPLIDELLSS